MTIPYSYRSKKGATLGLVIACVMLIALIGFAFVYFIQTFSGDKQIVNATDAGALAAAQQILTVKLTPSQASALPTEFLAYGVDSSGNVCPSGFDSNGNPTIFNEIAYNNCASYVIQICLNAALINTTAAINGANTAIANLNTFASQLDANIQASPNMANAASNVMASNSISNLPGKIFTGSQTSTTLVPGSLKIGYYVTSDPTSNVTFPNSFTTKDPQITTWVNSFLSNTPSSANGPNYIKAATPFNINTITGKTGFMGTIALVPFKASQLTHLISNDLSGFTTTLPGITTLPHNAIQLAGQSNAAAGSNSSSSATLGAGSSGSLNLTALSAAVVNGPSAVVNNIPAYSPPPAAAVATTPVAAPATSPPAPVPTPAYIAIINGGDYVANMNNAGYTAAAIQASSANPFGYYNQNITANTNIAFNDSQTNIFDLYNNALIDLSAGQRNMLSESLVVGLSDITPYSSMANGVTYYQDDANYSGYCPASNYNNIVDNPGLTATTPSIPFVSCLTPIGNTGPSITQGAAIQAFQAWISYNSSKGTDALGHNAALDPLQGSGGSPALFGANQNSVVPNSIIRATSNPGQIMTIADALKIKSVEVLNGDCQSNGFNGQLGWVDSLLPVIAANYGIMYLPTPVGEYRPNGLTAIEYLKAQYTCLHGGLGLSNTCSNYAFGGQVIPELPSEVPYFMTPPGPMLVPSPPISPGASCKFALSYSTPGMPATPVSSGLRYFQPFDTNGNPVHYAWPEPAGCPKFEMDGTPLQLLQNIEIMQFAKFTGKGSLTVSPSDPYYNNLLSKMLVVVQQMNANITLNDLTTVLNSRTIGLGQTLYLIYDPTKPQNDGLQIVDTLPVGTTYQPADSTQPAAACGVEYSLCAGLGKANNFNNALIDTAAAPNSIISYNGQNICPAPYGDNKMPIFSSTNDQTYPPFVWPALRTCAEDTATFYPSSGANNNHGELHFSETLYDTSLTHL